MNALDWIAIGLGVLVAVDLAVIGWCLRLARLREEASRRRSTPVEDVGPIRRDLPRDRRAA